METRPARPPSYGTIAVAPALSRMSNWAGRWSLWPAKRIRPMAIMALAAMAAAHPLVALTGCCLLRWICPHILLYHFRALLSRRLVVACCTPLLSYLVAPPCFSFVILASFCVSRHLCHPIVLRCPEIIFLNFGVRVEDVIKSTESVKFKFDNFYKMESPWSSS